MSFRGCHISYKTSIVISRNTIGGRYNMKEEIWKDIEGYEGYYQISNMGRVKSLERTVRCNRGYRTVPEKILEGSKNTYGYLQVELCQEAKKNYCTIHRLVAQAFLDNSEGYKEINHKDEDKTNNCVENLEWCDRSYNTNYGTRNQRAGEKLRGRKHSEETIKKIAEKLRGRKLSEETIKKIAEKQRNNSRTSKPVYSVDKVTGEIKEYPSAKEAERCTGIYHGSIIRCCRGERNSAGGFHWFYADDDNE